MTRSHRIPRGCLRNISAAIALFAGIAATEAQTDANNLEQENQELRARLDKLENIMKKEGLTPKDDKDPPVSAMSSVSISGFVTASWFSDVSTPHDNHAPGYLWNTSLNSFTLNKLKLTLASPDVQKDKWDAAYRASFIWGSDAPVVDTGSHTTVGGTSVAAGNGFSWLREAYVEMNIPIGTGLDFRAGDLISLLNYESGDGGSANDNFSQSYDWYYTGNPPDVGIQAGYDFTDWLGIKLRLQNGLYSGPVAIGGKTFIGGIYLKPNKESWVDLLGFVGHQDFSPGWDIAGGEVLGGYKLFEKHNVAIGTELDYFRFYNFDSALAGFPGGANDGDFWSAAFWLGADITSNLRIALRAEYLADPTGFGTVYNSPAPGADASFDSLIYASAAGTAGPGQDLEELTLTLDYKPVPMVKIQPEIRWNHSNYGYGFGTAGTPAKKDEIIAGMGVSYLF